MRVLVFDKVSNFVDTRAFFAGASLPAPATQLPVLFKEDACGCRGETFLLWCLVRASGLSVELPQGASQTR
jgi:hypothetical protein